jgi:hypothetical protein
MSLPTVAPYIKGLMPHDLPQQLLGPHLLLEHPGREVRVAMQLASYLALQFLMLFFVYLFAALLRRSPG